MKIFMSLHFNEEISTRNEVRTRLESLVPENSKIIIDFSKISFISRSAADEFINILIENQVDATLINLNRDLDSMFRIVYEAKRNGIKRLQKPSSQVVYI